jgi:heme exporter protein A
VRAGRLVFEGLSFALGPGDALLLHGPNGSGKSSLLRMLAGFLPPAAGHIVWDGAGVAADPPAHRARLHYIGHADGIKPALSVRENIDFAAALAGGAAQTGHALEAFGLAPLADVPCRLLSAGQKRRTALSRLLGTVRPLWLLDEPAVGLDATSRARLERVLAGHRATGGIVVLATHGDLAVPDALVLELGP